MFIFWRWPVDSVLTRWSRWSCRPTASISSSVRFQPSRVPSP